MLPTAPPQAVTGGPDQLAVVAAQFPGFCIWRSVTAGRIRYIARALRLEITPYAVVCGDLEELEAVLSAGQPGACASAAVHAEALSADPQ